MKLGLCYIANDTYKLSYNGKSIIYRNYKVGINKKVVLYTDIFNYTIDIPVMIFEFNTFEKRFSNKIKAIEGYNNYINSYIAKRLCCSIKECSQFWIEPDLYKEGEFNG